jgi:TP901 family phage tail tape measure protein
MATIYRIVTQLTADPRPMQEGVDRGTRILKDYARAVGSVLSGIPKGLTGPAAVEAGTRIGQALLTGMRDGFDARQSELREAMARGVLSKPQYEALAAENAKAYNTVLLNAMDNRALKTILPPQVRAQFVGALKDVGTEGENAIEDSFTRLGGKLRSFGRDLTQTGRELTIALTAPIVAGALAALASADNFEHAVQGIEVATGRVGPDLEGMAGHVRNLFLSLPNSASDIGKALQTISTYSTAAGTDLEKIATTALNLSRITGTDLSQNVESTQRSFRAWGVAAADQVHQMDILFRTSQQTGVGVAQLAGSLARFQPAFRQLGLGFGDAAALIGQFEKNGLDADTVLTSLQTSLSRFAAKGLDGHQALALIIHDLKAAGSEAEATNLASRFLGGREAVQFSTAVRNGTLDLEAFTNTIRASGTTIDGTAAHFDEFGARLSVVGHTAALSSALIGESLQHAFVNFAPAATGALGTMTDLVRSFLSLPQPILTGTGAIVALLAAVGPLALAFGGLTKGVGATVLALGLIRDGRAAVALTQLQGATVGATSAMTEAEASAAKLLAGLRLLAGVTVVLVGIGVLLEFWREYTQGAREAAERTERFRTSLHGLSQEQLTLNTEQMAREIALRQRDIDALKQSIADVANQQIAAPTSLAQRVRDATRVTANALGAGALFNQLVPDTDPLHALVAQLDDANSRLGEAKQRMGALGDATEEAKKAADRAAEAQANFNRQVNALLQQPGTGIRIDPHGDAIGTMQKLQAEAKKLNDMLRSTEPLKIPTDVVRTGLTLVNDAIDKIKIKGHSIDDTFPELTQDMKDLEAAVARTLARITQLGPSFRQLSNPLLTAASLDLLDRTNAKVKEFGDSMGVNAQKARELQAELRNAFVVKIERNEEGSTPFVVDVVGNVVRLDTSRLDTGEDFGQVVDAGLANIRQLAEQVQAAQQQLAKAQAGGFTAQVTDAEQALERYYARANEGERQYRIAITNSNVSVAQREEALKQLDVLNSQFGLNAQQLNVSPGMTQDDVSAFLKSAQEVFNALPPVTLKVIPFENDLDLRTAAEHAAKLTVDAQLAALAGNMGASDALNAAALDQFANTVKLDAQLARTGPVDQRALALKRLADQAKAAGFSETQVAKALDDQRPISQVLKIADAFSAAASSAFGANSAVAAFAGSIDTAVKGAKQLVDVINSIGSGGKFDIANLISGVGGVVTGIVGLLGGLHADPMQQEHDQILKSNNEALDALKISLDRNADGAGHLGDVINAFFKANVENQARNVDQNPAASVFSSQDAFTKFLQTTNVTFAEVNAAAKALGFTLVDSMGNLVGLDASFEALIDQMRILGTVSNDLASQQKRLSVLASIEGGKQTPRQQLDDSVNALATALDTHGGTLGKQLQAANAAGPDALRKFLLELFNKINEGFFADIKNFPSLGSLKDVNELLDAIGGVSDSMNSLADATNTALGALLNVPAGFKRALDEFNAQAPQAPPGTPGTQQGPAAPPPTDTVPTRGPDPTGPLLDLVKQVQDHFTSPLVGAVSGPVDAMDRLRVSASDVADALDAMFHVKQSLTDRADLSGAPTSQQRVDLGALARELATERRRAASTPSTTGGDVESAQPVVHIHGDVNIDAQTKPVDQAFTELARIARQKAKQLTGDSTRVVDALQRG